MNYKLKINESNLSIAKEVCNQVRSYHLKSSSRLQFLMNTMSYSDQRWLNLGELSTKIWRGGLKETRDAAGEIENRFKYSFELFHDKLKNLFKEHPYGNCAEQADLTYLELLSRGFRAYKIDFSGTYKKNGNYLPHNFVIFNTEKPLKKETLERINLEKLPKSAIIVDPWANFVGFCTKEGWNDFFNHLKLRQKGSFAFYMKRMPDIQTDLDTWTGKKLQYK